MHACKEVTTPPSPGHVHAGSKTALNVPGQTGPAHVAAKRGWPEAAATSPAALAVWLYTTRCITQRPCVAGPPSGDTVFNGRPRERSPRPPEQVPAQATPERRRRVGAARRRRRRWQRAQRLPGLRVVPRAGLHQELERRQAVLACRARAGDAMQHLLQRFDLTGLRRNLKRRLLDLDLPPSERGGPWRRRLDAQARPLRRAWFGAFAGAAVSRRAHHVSHGKRAGLCTRQPVRAASAEPLCTRRAGPRPSAWPGRAR